MRRILFRADAHEGIGTGDLVSLVTLSRYFEKNHWETYFLIKDFAAAKNIVSAHRLKNITVIDRDCPIEKEIRIMNDFVRTQDIKVIFLEITERPLESYGGLSEDCLKAAVSFTASIPDNFEVIINWDVTAQDLFDHLRYPRTIFLLGPQYVILPVGLDYSRVNDRRYKEQPEIALIFMGGCDELDLTRRVVEAVKNNNGDLALNIIIGAGYRYRKILEKELGSSSRFSLKQNIVNMIDEYLKCDIAIVAGGLSAFELMATRTPSLLIATHEQQISRCQYFDRMKWARYLGFRDFDAQELMHSLSVPPLVPRMPFADSDKIRQTIEGLYERRYPKG